MEDRKSSLKLKAKKYEYVPPDGGWGYLVAISAIICFSTTTSFSGSFGIMFNEFINEVSMSSASVTLLSGIYSLAIAFTGFFTSALLSIMSMRWLAFTASVIFAFGTFGAVIMTTPFMFFLTAGVLQGAGLGILYNLSCTIINDYFVEKRILIMSFVQTATGVNAMVAPMVVRWSIEQYGSRGTILLVAGLSLHNFIAVLLMQPVRWHMKRLEVPEKAELKILLEENNDFKKLDTPVIKLTDFELNTKEGLEKAFEVPEKKKSGIRKVLDSIIDPSLLRTYVLSGAALGTSMCCNADGIHTIMAPQYLYAMNWSNENVAMAITLYGFGDLATRILFTMIYKWMNKIGVKNMYIIGAAIAAIARLGMLWSSSVIPIMVFFTVIGVAHCFIVVLLPLVISETVAPDKFTSAMGISCLLTGTSSLAVGPAIGAVRDYTQSYSVAFYILTLMFAIVVILWPIELIIKNRRRKTMENNLKSSQVNKGFN
uniref:Major facilitator superfamily (MFS) profile domain-containing protein n=1 Tax=Heliothis virescens TaxID=7102 RepID=A0A2A4K764_HELVI